jgi:hypothetical protein
MTPHIQEYSDNEDWLSKAIAGHDSDECLEWPFKRDRDGYGRVWHEGKTVGAHRLAFKVANGHWPEANALHSCDNPPCINSRHLSDGSTLRNQNEKAERGRSLRGEQQHDAKLTEQGVIMARMLYSGGSTFRELAAQYGLTPAAIRWAVIGKTWSHVPGAIRSRGVARRAQPFCGKGHSLFGDNVYSYPNGKGFIPLTPVGESDDDRRGKSKSEMAGC